MRELECAFFDLDSFFASVEAKHLGADPRVPLVVAKQAVTSANQSAKRMGVKAGMSTAQAERLVAGLVVVEPRIELYRTESRLVMGVLRESGCPMQQLSIDEAYLDLRGFEDRIGGVLSGVRLAAKLRKDVKRECGLEISAGVARGRVSAKMAVEDAKPDGLFAVREEQLEEWLMKKSVRAVPGIGEQAARLLDAKSIVTLGQARSAGLRVLQGILGQARGLFLWGVIDGSGDVSLVDPGVRAKSRGAESTLAQTCQSVDEVRELFDELVADACGRLLEDGVWARGVRVVVRGSGGEQKARQTRVETTRRYQVVRRAAGRLLEELITGLPGGVRLVGVSLYDLVEHEDMTLFTTSDPEVFGEMVGETWSHPVFGDGLVVRQRGDVRTVSFPDRRREIEV